MKRIIMFVLLFAALKVAGQTTGYLRFDTVKIMKQNGTCELYVINKTKDSLGLLTNVGGGLTQFRRSKMLNDSTIIIGLDTITIHGTGATPAITQLTGDVTAGPGSGSQAATISNNAVTTTKINNGAVTIPKLSATGTADGTTFLRGDGTWAAPPGGSPGGSDTYVQYNSSGSFGAESAFTYDASANTLAADTITGKRLQLAVTTAFTPDTLTIFGDSWTTAVGATDVKYGYARLLAGHLQLTLKNMGVSGSTLEKRTPTDPYGTSNMVDRTSTIPTKTARYKYLMFAYGLNDVGYNNANYTPTNFSTDYHMVIDAAVAKGWAASDIIIVSPWYVGDAAYSAYASLTGTTAATVARHIAFVDTSKAVAAFYGTRFFDIYRSMAVSGADKLPNYDGIHPGNQVHALIAEMLASYINYTVLKNGQANATNGITELQKLKLSGADTALDNYTDRVMVLDTGNVARVAKINSFHRNNTTTIPDPSQLYISGKIISQDISNMAVTITDKENIISNGGIKGGYLRANGSIPSGLAGSAVEIGMIGSAGYVGAYDRTGSSGLNLFLNPFGAVVMGGLSPSGSATLQLTGNMGIASGKLRIGDLSTPTMPLEVISNQAMLIPIGLTSQRPAGVAGYVRANIDSTNLPEYYDGTIYQALASRNWVRSNFGSGGITSINSQTGSSQTISAGPGLAVNSSSDVHTISFNNTLDYQVSDANNVGTSATDLYSKTVAANQFTLNGQSIHFEAAGVNNDATATVNLEALFAGNGIAGTGAVTISATGAWTITGTIIRATSTTARVYTTVTIDQCTQKVFLTTANLTGLDWTTTNVLKIRATAGGGGGGNDDITAQMWKVVFQP